MTAQIDWPMLVDDIAWQIHKKWRGRWLALASAMVADGVQISVHTVSGWGRGVSAPGGDAAVWLYRRAEALGRPIPARKQQS